MNEQMGLGRNTLMGPKEIKKSFHSELAAMFGSRQCWSAVCKAQMSLLLRQVIAVQMDGGKNF